MGTPPTSALRVRWRVIVGRLGVLISAMQYPDASNPRRCPPSRTGVRAPCNGIEDARIGVSVHQANAGVAPAALEIASQRLNPAFYHRPPSWIRPARAA